MSIRLIGLITTAVYTARLKSEYLFRTCSVATNLVISLQFHSDLCYYAVPFVAKSGAIPYSLIFNPIAALLQAVLQNEHGTIPEWPSRNEEQNNTG